MKYYKTLKSLHSENLLETKPAESTSPNRTKPIPDNFLPLLLWWPKMQPHSLTKRMGQLCWFITISLPISGLHSTLPYFPFLSHAWKCLAHRTENSNVVCFHFCFLPYSPTVALWKMNRTLPTPEIGAWMHSSGGTRERSPEPFLGVCRNAKGNWGGSQPQPNSFPVSTILPQTRIKATSSMTSPMYCYASQMKIDNWRNILVQLQGSKIPPVVLSLSGLRLFYV